MLPLEEGFFFSVNRIFCISLWAHFLCLLHFFSVKYLYILTDNTHPSILLLRVNSCSSHSLPFMLDAPVPSQTSWLFAGLPPVCPFLNCTGDTRTGQSTAGTDSRAEQRKRIPSLYLLVRLCLTHCRTGLSGRKKWYISMPSSETLYPTSHQVNQKFKPAGSEAKLFL